MKSPFASSFFGSRVESGRSDYHHYEFVQNDRFGLSLFLDGIIQSTEKDQAVYHSNMVNKALQVNRAPENVLIIGGAGGGLLPYIFLHYSNTVRSISVVDIDEKLFSISRKRMSSWDKSHINNRLVKLKYEDGLDTLRKNEDRYDLIFCDISDAADWTQSSMFYKRTSKSDICNNLTDNGAFIFHQPCDPRKKPAPSAFSSLNIVDTSTGITLDDPLRVSISSFESPWLFNAYVKTRKS